MVFRHSPGAAGAITTSSTDYTTVKLAAEEFGVAKLVEAALKNIFKNEINLATDIERNLFKIVFDKLNAGIDVAFPAIDYTSPDLEFVYQLKHNAGVFSAFKVHKLQNNIAGKLTDEKGNLRTFSEFKKVTQGLIKKDHRHLQTEYNTAVIRARNAAKWKVFERDQDLFPNLKWTPSTSVEKRDYHIRLYGFIAPFNDPFWAKHYPGDLWGCKCGITNTSQPVTDKMPAIDAGMKPDIGLDTNPGITGELFTKSHPVFTKSAVPYKKLLPLANKLSNTVVMKMVERVMKRWKETLPAHNGKNFTNTVLKTGSIKVLRKAVADTRGHSADPFVLLSLRNINNRINDWRYLGWKENKVFPIGHKLAGKRKHHEASYFMYYETEIHGKTRYINAMMHKHYNMETFYCILDRKPRGIKKGLPGK